MPECPKEEKGYYKKSFSVSGDLVTEQVDTKSTTHQEITEKWPKSNPKKLLKPMVVTF